MIQVSHKDSGDDFTEEDEAILVQLAQMSAVALENTRLYEALSGETVEASFDPAQCHLFVPEGRSLC